MSNPTDSLLRYRDGRQVAGFQPNVTVIHPRQVNAADPAVYLLDRAGRRILTLDPQDGKLLALYQFLDRRTVTCLWAGPAGELILAGRDALYFAGPPAGSRAAAGWPRQVIVEGEAAAGGPWPNDPAFLDGLRGLRMPIDGAHITGRDFQMPGAPRHYRLGVHEGTDFYGYAVGVTVTRTTPVRAVADGIVIRALTGYEPLTRAQADAWAADVRRLGYTSPEALDGYRGRQVWIQHDSGLVSRYAHLSAIAPGIEVGASVKQGQVIATVGNSGTPASLDGPGSDVHLHLELWLGDHYIGQFLRPIETREWTEKILR
jgi:murein DD-endopeptidase MepM/ murein hydrolase activator NlpD